MRAAYNSRYTNAPMISIDPWLQENIVCPRDEASLTLESTFTELIGPTETYVDGFLSLNAQAADRSILPLPYRIVVSISESLRRASKTVGGLKHVADSIYVESTKPASA